MAIFEKLARFFNPPGADTNLANRPEAPPPLPAPPLLTVDYTDERIPSSAQARINAILKSLADIKAAIRPGIGCLTQEVEAGQMRDRHLPQLVQSYIDIPPMHRAEIFRSTGKSASFILCENLDRMQDSLKTMLQELAQTDLDAFRINSRFIEERYTQQNDPFKPV